MLKTSQMWLKLNKSVKKSGPKFLYSDMKDSLPVDSKCLVAVLLPIVAQAVTRFRGHLVSHIGPDRLE